MNSPSRSGASEPGRPAHARRPARALLVAGGAVALTLIVLLLSLGGRRPPPADYAPWVRDRIDLPARQPGAFLRLTFLGTTTVLVEDGRNAVMTDGFFSRPSLSALLTGRIAPDVERIQAGLQQAFAAGPFDAARPPRLDAVLPLHSHHDHAMDAPEVALRTGALLLGSDSTRMIGLGWGLPEQRMRVVRPGDVSTFGDMTLRWLASPHSPVPALVGRLTGIGQAIEQPVRTPASLADFKEGQTFSLLIEHPAGRVLIHGSAAVADGGLRGVTADVVFLGIATLIKQPLAVQRDYLRQVVLNTGARLVVPVHWDDFTRSAEGGLVAMPYLVDDLVAGLRFLDAELATQAGVALHLLPMGGQVVLGGPAR